MGAKALAREHERTPASSRLDLMEMKVRLANPLYDSLFGRHRDNPEPFLLLAAGEALSYRDFLALSARYAALLTARGATAGERVAVQVEKSHQALALYAACLQAGAIYLPLNTAYTTDELRYFLEDSDACMLVCDSLKAPGLAPLADSLGCQMLTLDADGTGTLADASRHLKGALGIAPRDEDDIAAILYTSGTTGRSKGAMLTHRNLLSNARALVEGWRFTESDVLLHVLPIFHSHGLFVATHVTLAAGARMIFLPRFDIDTVVANLPLATTMMGVPTFYTRLLEDLRLNADLVGHMRLFISGSAPLLADTHTRFESRTGHRILERYGLTETSMNTSNPYEGERRPGTVGFPLPGIEVRITDPATAALLAGGEIGQIEVHGPNVFKGYWRNPEKTAADLRPDGWFITGDLGRVDADGYLHIVGRDKDLIISGGYNIYPKEIELLLDAQPGILESAVIGVPHPDFGESVVAVLVADDSGPPDLDALAAEVADRLARFKHPRRFVTIDTLPRNAMGKVQKALLRAQYRDEFKERL
jgi:malonyl-CoA/methylmalonyl-CoA synthetase